MFFPDKITYKKTKTKTKNRLTNLESDLVVARKEETVREFSMDMYILLYLKWVTNKALLCSTWNSAQCYVAASMGGKFRGEWRHVYVWLSPFAVHLKLL